MKKKSRLTVDMTPEQHTSLKMAAAKLGVTMREFLLVAAFERIKEVESAWPAQSTGDIQTGKTVS